MRHGLQCRAGFLACLALIRWGYFRNATLVTQYRPFAARGAATIALPLHTRDATEWFTSLSGEKMRLEDLPSVFFVVHSASAL